MKQMGLFLIETIEGSCEGYKEDLEIIVYNVVAHRNSFHNSFISTSFTSNIQDSLIAYSPHFAISKVTVT